MTEADVVIFGPTYTVVAAQPWAEAVAVSGGRIAAVGSRDEVEGVVGPGTRVIDARDGMVLPGFQDAHIHPTHGGLERMRCDLHDLAGVDEYRRAVVEYAASHPDVPWILGGGWSLADFPNGTPHRSILDEVVPDRPAYLKNRDGHGAWVNTRALELAGVTRGTPDPPDGRIEREPAGSPFGVLHEGAMQLVSRVIPETTPREMEEALLEGQRYLHSLGITGWQDAWVAQPEFDAYVSAAASGHLTARVVAAQWWERDRGEEQIAELVERRERGNVGRLRATSVKIMQDGIPENFTAAMIERYLDEEGRPGDRRGLSFIDPEALKRYVELLDAERFQVHVHAIGDRAVREALDAFEHARSVNVPSDNRHHIAHLQIVNPLDVRRFAELAVTATAQPYWACLDRQMRELVIPFIGEERTTHQYPFAALVRTGARLAFGSDWPVTTANPLHEIQVAMTRVPFDERDQPAFLPDERLDLATCLQAFTLGSAYVNHLDDVTGSITPGKAADLVVLDRNLFDLEAEEVGEAKVVLTLVEGEPVYGATG